MMPVTLCVRFITHVFVFFIQLGVRFLRPLWERIETELSPITQELHKAHVWFRSVGEQIWNYRWQLGLGVVVLIILLGYLLLQAFFIYLFLYNFLLVTPIQEHMEKPLHFEFPSRDWEGLPRTDFILDETVMTRNQAYQMKILISLPESPPNFEIGMFMVNLDLTYENENSSTCQPQVAGQSRRHAVLRWKTGLHRILYTFFYWFPLVLGVTAVEEKQTLEVVMFDEFVYAPTRDGDHLAFSIWLSEPDIQIYQGTLFIRAELHGLSLSIAIIRYNKNQEDITSGTGRKKHKVPIPDTLASVVGPTAVGGVADTEEDSSSEAEAAGIGLPTSRKQVVSPTSSEDKGKSIDNTLFGSGAKVPIVVSVSST